MSGTSVLKIDVDDEAFRGFMDLFQNYQSALGDLPEAWQDVNKATSGSAVEMADLVALIATQTQMLREVVAGHKEVEKAASRVDSVMASVGKRVETAAKSAAKMTLELVKWGSISGLAFAGLGGLGLFGIDKLGAAASQISRSARGIGVDPAAQQAFGVNYRQYVNPDAMLANTAQMQADVRKWGSFLAAGISTQEVQRDDPEELSRRTVMAAKELWDRAGPNNRTTQYMQAHGLDALLPGGLEDWKRIGGASRDELEQAGRDSQRDRRDFALDPKALKAWTEFTNQMDRAKVTMEDVLIGKLAPLAKPLTDLSTAFTRAISDFLSDPDLGHWTLD